MNRGLVTSLSALALAVSATAFGQNAQVSLNLRYSDPADPTEGGSWVLVAKTDDNDGLAAVNAYISNINSTGVSYGTSAAGYTAVTGTQLNAALNAGNPFVVPGTPVNVVYYQNTSAAGVVTGVGTATSTLRTAQDPLGSQGASLTDPFDNATAIASGTIVTGSTPAFAPKNGNNTDANTLPGTTAPFNNAQDAATTAVVRSDALTTLGGRLLRGDVNRNLRVDSTDLNIILANFNKTGKTWDTGDVTDGLAGHVEGTVNSADLNNVLANFNKNSPAPATAAVGSVPEPTSLGLIAGAIASLAVVRRRMIG